jgi:hypothetical protein
MQHLLLKTSNEIVITDYAITSGICGKLAVFDGRKVRQVPESFVFLLLLHTSGTDICNKKHPELAVEKKEEEEEEAFWGKEKKAKQKRRKSKRSETSEQIPAQLQRSHPPNFRPSLSPVHPERLPTHYPLNKGCSH